MTKEKYSLSKRESQIMKIIYRLGEATVTDIVVNFPVKISSSSVSKFLWLLEEKGLLLHKRDGKRNVYHPAVSPEKASENIFDNLAATFFQGSASMTFSALLNNSRDKLSNDEVDQLFELIKEFKENSD